MLSRAHIIIHETQLAARQLRRSPSFTFAVLVTLALGIGINAAIFTMVDCVLLRPLGYREADRIYSIQTRLTAESRWIAKIGGDDYADLSAGVRSLEYAAYYSDFEDGLQLNGRTLFTDIGSVSPAFGQVMGVEPLAGRLFSLGTDGRGGAIKNPEEALVSSGFARANFGTAARAVGQTLSIEGQVRTIVGVLPDGFSFPGKTQVWAEAPSLPEVPSRTAYNQHAVGRLRPGVNEAQLNAELGTFSRRLAAAYPDDREKALEGVPLQEQIVGGIRPILRLLMGAVAVVLLIVCANITHLQLVRATRLRREVTIRAALGATRMSLVRRTALEVLLLAGAGCAAGVLVALPALRVLVRLAPPEIPRLGEIRLNPEVIAFSFAVSAVTMAAAALLPLWRSWQIDPSSAMKQDAARSTESRATGRLRQALIVGEVMLTLTLSVVATLLVRQLIAESRQDLGFVQDHLVMLDTHKIAALASLRPEQVSGPNADPAAIDAAKRKDVQVLDELVAAIRAVPGVTRAAAVSGAPAHGGTTDVDYAIRGVNEFKPGVHLPNANIVAVTPGYLETMEIPLLRGRAISEEDRMGSQPVAMISASMARQNFPGEDPVGKQIMCGWDDLSAWITIVGVVGDVRQESPASAPYPTIYAPVTQHAHASSDMQVMARTASDPESTSTQLTRVLERRFPQVALKGATMRENVTESERAQHFRTLLFSSFAGVSIRWRRSGLSLHYALLLAPSAARFWLQFCARR